MYYKHGEALAGAGATTRIYRNLFHPLGSGSGVASNQSRSEILRNVFDGCGAGLHNEDGTQAPFTLDVTIARNTFVGGQIALPIQHGDSAFPGPRDTSLLRNLRYDAEVHIWTYGSDADYQDGIGLVSHDNCYFRAAGPQTIDYFGNNSPAYGGETTGGNYTLTEFQALGFDALSVEAEPLLVDEVAGDFRLQAGSPCAGRGALPSL